MTLDWAALTLAPCMTIMGARVLYERPGEPGFTVPGIFTRTAAEAAFQDMPVPNSISRVSLDVALADFPSGFVPTQSDRLQVAFLRGQHVDAVAPPAGAKVETFDVMDVQRDGAGGAVLLLSGRVPDDLA